MKNIEDKLLLYWSEIPIGKSNAYTYDDLCRIWGCSERKARLILHELSSYDDGSNYILIRSASGKGFYRTDDMATIRAYRQECLNKGRNMFAPLRKINRVINLNATQYSLNNNLRVVRVDKNLSQSEVCQLMKEYDCAFDKSLLSKMENNICLPTPLQLARLAEIYGCEPDALISDNLY